MHCCIIDFEDFGCKILSDIPNPPHMSSFMYINDAKVSISAYLYIRALVEKKSKIELSLIS